MLDHFSCYEKTPTVDGLGSADAHAGVGQRQTLGEVVTQCPNIRKCCR
jgi:hypothetical protein